MFSTFSRAKLINYARVYGLWGLYFGSILLINKNVNNK